MTLEHALDAILPAPQEDSKMPKHSLEEIVELLDRNAQRATYGAVAKLTGNAPRSLLKGRDRGRNYSWIVNRQTGKPTGYKDDQIDPRLADSQAVIDDADELQRWLDDAATNTLALATSPTTGD
jgi:hypothetical protein